MTKYQYNHPEGTGKTESPFDSIWYCGLPESMVSDAIVAFHKFHGCNEDPAIPRLARSLDELKLAQAVPTSRRRNPRQRKKDKARLEAQNDLVGKSMKPKPSIAVKKIGLPQPPLIIDAQIQSSKMKSSIYRDEKGDRKKRRF